MKVSSRLAVIVKLSAVVVAVAIFVGLWTAHLAYAAAGINTTLNFQGKVVNSNGTNVTDGTYDFVFKMYDGAGSAATTLFTESWTSSALWSSTMSSAPTSGGESLTYSSNTNESTIKVGQILWNATKVESVVVTSVNTSTNVIGISPTAQAWSTGDTVTNKIYVKDGIFRVAINGLNQDLSGVDFNSDTIFLGVNFNADGEMKPRIQYTAVPYALNAQKVNGLTVTNTTGTLTIPNGKTVSFGDAFTTSGANALTLTTTSTTNVTLPTTGTLATLAGLETLTNKTIGSTGLTFSGASLDITTGTNEDLTIIPNGTGKIGIGTTTPVAYLHVTGAVKGKALAIFDETGDQAILTASSSGTPVFIITHAGNIGIGTTSPVEKFELAGNAQITSTAPQLVFNETDNVPWKYRVDGDQFIIQRNGADKFLMTNTQVLVKGDLINNASSLFRFGATAASSKLILQSNNADQLIIDQTGSVGIGTTAPSAKFHVSGAVTGKALAVFDETGDQALFTASAAGIPKFLISHAGNVGIGTTNPLYSLDTIGALRIQPMSAPTAAKGVMYFDTSANKFKCSEDGVTFTNCIGTGGAGSSVWSDLTSPTGNLALTMGANTSTFTYNAATGTSDLFKLTDTASNTGTGYLMNLTTASGSTLKPLRVVAAGSDALAVTAAGNVGIGTTSPLVKFSVNANGAADSPALSNTYGMIQNAGVTRFETRNATNNTSVILTADTANSEIDTNNEFLYLGAASNRQLQLMVNGDTIMNPIAGNIGIGTTAPTYKVDAVSSSTAGIMQLTGNSITTGVGLNLIANGLTSGKALSISSTSTALTSGNLINLDWSPGSATAATGDLFSLNIGANGTIGNLLNLKDNGASVFSVSQTAITNGLPTSFTAPGDVSIAYDLAFTNQTASYIKSNAPLYLEAGESFESNDLTLRTFNNGNVIVDLTGAGGLGIGSSVSPQGKFHVEGAMTGKALAIFNETGDQALFTASASGVTKLVVDHTGNVGIGTTSPTAQLQISNLAATTQTGLKIVGGTAVTTGTDLDVNGAVYIHTTAETGNLSKFTFTDASTNTSGATVTNGLDISSTVNTSGAGTKTVNGINIEGSTLTGCASGACTVNGLQVATTATSNSLITQNAINIIGSTASNGTEIGLNIGAITGGGGTEYALQIGSGWDRGLSVASASTFTAAITSQATLTVGSAGNTFTFDPSAGPTYAGTARPSKSIKLSPEFLGATLTASGSATTNGNMTSDTVRDTTAGWENYYEWSSTQGSFQDYTIAVKVTLPSDFAAWATSNALQINYATENTSTSKNKLDFSIYNMTTNPDKVVYQSLTNASGTNGVWTTATVDKTQLSDGVAPDWDTAGQTAVIFLKSYSLVDAVNCTAGVDNGCYVRLGDIVLNYLGKY